MNKRNPPHCVFCQSDSHYTVDHPKEERTFTRKEVAELMWRAAQEINDHSLIFIARERFASVIESLIDDFLIPVPIIDPAQIPIPLPFELRALTKEDKLELYSYFEWKPEPNAQAYSEYLTASRIPSQQADGSDK